MEEQNNSLKEMNGCILFFFGFVLFVSGVKFAQAVKEDYSDQEKWVYASGQVTNWEEKRFNGGEGDVYMFYAATVEFTNSTGETVQRPVPVRFDEKAVPVGEWLEIAYHVDDDKVVALPEFKMMWARSAKAGKLFAVAIFCFLVLKVAFSRKVQKHLDDD